MKLAFYCIGNYTEILYLTAKQYVGVETVLYLQNFKGLKFLKQGKDKEIEYRYQFEKFNEDYERSEIDDEINYNVIWSADKSHYKRMDSKYVEKIISTFASTFKNWLAKDKPDFIFFPIIESLDAMCLYEIAQSQGIKTLVYSHFRLMPYSFIAHNKYEEIPEPTKEEWIKIKEIAKTEGAKKWLESLSQTESRLSDQMSETIKSINNKPLNINIFKPGYERAVKRYIFNVIHLLTKEKHNKILNNFTKFQVYIEKILVPLQKFKFKMIEKIYLKRYERLEDLDDYNFFALHFSPESSINTPAPYFIDQIRVVDKVLLDDKRPLVIREHPAVYGKRSMKFYRELFTRPKVYYSNSDQTTTEQIKNANTVYTVTGTVAIEAFFRKKKFKQFGRNYFSAFLTCMRDQVISPEEDERLLLIGVVKHFGDEFVIMPHGQNKKDLNNAMFSSHNVSTFIEALNKAVRRYKVYGESA